MTNKNHFLPERILQFGTGILLRGLPDCFVHEANQRGIFNGSILVVKSTDGEVSDFSNGFKTYIRGSENGKIIDDVFLNSAISRVLSANHQWPLILAAAEDPNIQIIISNTTEAGLQLTKESIFQKPPVSFPAKLTAFLYERFQKLGVDAPETLIIPTELISDNGGLLKSIVHELVIFNQLGDSFAGWLDRKIIFSNSLVDRIVTKSAADIADPLAVQTEPYRLWAIEGDSRVSSKLSFGGSADGLIVSADIAGYRERKLRLLNGTHTFMACLGFVSGYNTVYECMNDAVMREFIENVMLLEILPTVAVDDRHEKDVFAKQVIDRFNNPFAKHQLISITLQATLKMRLRNVPSLLAYYSQYDTVPEKMALGFAGYLQFMKPVEKTGHVFYGVRKGEPYPIQDDQALYFHDLWKHYSRGEIVDTVCRNTTLWQHDLTLLPGFTSAVAHYMEILDAVMA